MYSLWSIIGITKLRNLIGDSDRSLSYGLPFCFFHIVLLKLLARLRVESNPNSFLIEITVKYVFDK